MQGRQGDSCALVKALLPEISRFTAALTEHQPSGPAELIHQTIYGTLREKEFYLSSIAEAILREESRKRRNRARADRFGHRKRTTKGRTDEHTAKTKKLGGMMRSPKITDDLLQTDYMFFLRELLHSDPQLVVAIDESDLQKRWSNQAGVKNNKKRSDKSDGRGWQLMAATAHLKGGADVLLYTQVYSDGTKQDHAEKGDQYLGLQRERQAAIRSIISHVPKNTVVVADRGFDNLEMFSYMTRTDLDFIFGVKHGDGSRWYWLPENGFCKAGEVIESITSWRRFTAKIKRKEVPSKIGFRSNVKLRVKTKGGGLSSKKTTEETYSMVIVDDYGADDRILVMLTSKEVRTFGDARRIYDLYQRRGRIEHNFRFLKNGKAKCEKQLLLRNWSAIRRQMSLVGYAVGFLAWLAIMRPRIAAWIIGIRLHRGRTPGNLVGRLWKTIGEALTLLNRMPRGP